MRIIEVPEWDSSWEGYDPRFRLYLFTLAPGASSAAVSTHDILEANVHEALEAAHMMSHGDTLLWSLALVENSDGARGLRWLSGMDYNSAPLNAVEWRARRLMQDRYLSAVTRAGREPRLPDGRRVLRMFSDQQSGWPLWESFTDHYIVTSDHLSLSSELSEDLTAWNSRFNDRALDDPLPEGWVEDGVKLWERLVAEIGDGAEVRPEFLG
ncbi:hypothetical protein [Microbacterium gorillae]|uniref:hypothetical protein n=1 Tax=Microbacterium gorillae TaxID=1231063 RepID=UPI003D98943F